MGTLQTRIAEAAQYAKSNGKSISKAEIARQCGISKQAVGYWFNGPTVTLDGDVLIKAARYFGVNAAWLAGEGNMFDGINASITSNTSQSNSLNKLVSDLQDLNAKQMLSEEAIQILQSTVTLLSKNRKQPQTDTDEVEKVNRLFDDAE